MVIGITDVFLAIAFSTLEFLAYSQCSVKVEVWPGITAYISHYTI